jgi:hypothetical protein
VKKIYIIIAAAVVFAAVICFMALGFIQDSAMLPLFIIILLLTLIEK